MAANSVLAGFNAARRVLAREPANLAFLIGNGINLSDGKKDGLSWDQLMAQLVDDAAGRSGNRAVTKRRLLRLLARGTDGQSPASQPEIFDIFEAAGSRTSDLKNSSVRKQGLQGRIAELLSAMQPGAAHRALVSWAVAAKTPILTTNYDHCLEEASGADSFPQQRFGTGRPMSDYYPWDRYYAPQKIVDPLQGFAIWHIHGDRALKRSIRAGLDQYMGMAQRLRKMKQLIAHETLHAAPTEAKELAAFHEAPWLRVFFGRKLFIQGLGLRAAEVSLRWLLIQRFRYWNHYRPQASATSGWYLHGPTDEVGHLESERRAFFENVGLEVIEIRRKGDCYGGLYRASERSGTPGN